LLGDVLDFDFNLANLEYSGSNVVSLSQMSVRAPVFHFFLAEASRVRKRCLFSESFLLLITFENETQRESLSKSLNLFAESQCLFLLNASGVWLEVIFVYCYSSVRRRQVLLVIMPRLGA
jgi:hypothetical protein